MIGRLVKEREEGKKLSLSQLQERNPQTFEDILPEHYEKSFLADYGSKNWEKELRTDLICSLYRDPGRYCVPLKCDWKEISRSCKLKSFRGL